MSINDNDDCGVTKYIHDFEEWKKEKAADMQADQYQQILKHADELYGDYDPVCSPGHD